MKNFKPSNTADELAEAEAKVADLTAQIDDAKLACKAADAAATTAVLAGKDVDAAVSASAKASAMLRALEAARETTNERVVALRRRHAEEESFATREAAKPVMYKFADALDAAEAEIMPVMARYSELASKGDDIIEFACGVGAIPGINAMVGAVRGPMKMLAEQLRGSADSILVPDEHGYRLATAKRALAAAAVLK